MSKQVAVTGASGLLGRAVATYFEQHGDEVLHLAFSRTDKKSNYLKLDFTDEEAVGRFFASHQIDGAAERRPDVAEALNVQSPLLLATFAKKYGFTLIVISTDYVFNGKNPPYETDSPTDPLNAYGQSKVDAEQAVLTQREEGAKVTVLRVPILYGRTEYNAESAVNIIRDVVEDQSGKQYKMDHVQRRYPTNVDDVARVLFDLTHLGKPLPFIVHYCSPSPALSKWDMTQIIARHLHLPISHITPETVVPPGATSRPQDAQLSTRSLQDIGVDVDEEMSFDDWWREYVKAS
ncbi:hypothetical protein TREMEDRAFT_68791 [Tremella mesenterica DSM 1558]|uniref:uncharacterized protein n=1 Tax=Tremella mesenterica (strain ATCC 24925 / CBS 8224 / DSM 1558 / NBRC 9311 / NRRL Y-6157 / RJB 2259-6 / UBC 559-6) TaxID=578456 RepID=UPI0003F49D6D|nr:uncharacterized protein TREMEDRAFT_68791 [Tremella mesenterica DSM 1558]EIW69634.1 hypothetical protein TREMEDRAFT_68791 [Tremella mesenterica DSM 1558]